MDVYQGNGTKTTSSFFKPAIAYVGVSCWEQAYALKPVVFKFEDNRNARSVKGYKHSHQATRFLKCTANLAAVQQ
jgi:hypothetical protein